MSENIIKILLIEDDREDSQFLQDLLDDAKRARFSVDAVFLGKEGLLKTQKNRYDVILLDYKLPDADGLDVLQELHRSQVQVPVVMVTSHGDRNLQTRALEAGAAEYLEKGAITADLLERTCIYANGLSLASLERFPEIRFLIDLAGSNSKDLQKIQIDLKTLKDTMDLQFDKLSENNSLEHSTQKSEHNSIQTSIDHLAKFRWLLDWVVLHPAATIIIVLSFVIVCISGVFILQAIDLEVVQKLLELKKSASLISEVPKWLLG